MEIDRFTWGLGLTFRPRECWIGVRVLTNVEDVAGIACETHVLVCVVPMVVIRFWWRTK